MAIDKPTIPEELLPDEFGGVKENFPDSLINTGYEADIPEVLGGANLNYFIDTLGKNFKYHRIISDYITNIPISKSLIVNSNNKLDYTQYGLRVYNATEVYGLGEWVVGNIENSGKKIYESLISNNTNNPLDSQYWQEVNLGKISSICFRSVGETVFSLTPLKDNSLRLLNGQLIDAGDIPDDFSEYISWLRANYPQCFVTESQWQTINGNLGECGKFVYDENTGDIRLPKLTGIVQGTNTTSDAGNIINAGLPSITHTHTRGTMNITGSLALGSSSTASGAFYISGKTKGEHGGGSGEDEQGYFNASRTWTGATSDNSSVSSIYGGSTTVQPQTVLGFYYIVFTNNIAEEEINEVIGDKASKAYVQAEIDDLENYIEETYATKQEVTSVYKPSGSILFSNLPILSSSVLGNVYNVTDSFTTDSRFVEGAGVSVPSGTNVVVVDIGTSNNPNYKFDLLSSNIDMSNYYTKNQVYNKPEIDIKLLEIQTGDVDVSQQISSVVDNKLVEGNGIDFISGLITSTTVTSNDEDLTITSSYSGTRPQAGKETFEFIYDGTNWLLNGDIVNLSNYYLTVIGTPVQNDTITLEYNTLTTTTIATEFDGDYDNLTNKPTITSSVVLDSEDILTSGGAYSNLVRRLSSSVATGSTSQAVYVDAGGQVQVCTSIPQSLYQTSSTLSSGTIALDNQTVIYKLTPSAATTLTFDTTNVDTTKVITFELCIDMSTAYSITFPASVTWQDATAPDLSQTGVYFLAFRTIDGGTTWYGNLQGKW